MDADLLIPLIAVLSIFVILPGMVFHYITIWRRQKTLMPDDEKMLEDLWHAAKRMERRIATLEQLVDADTDRRGPRVDPTDTRSFDQ